LRKKCNIQALDESVFTVPVREQDRVELKTKVWRLSLKSKFYNIFIGEMAKISISKKALELKFK
jgi:hypothetical protein